MSAINNGQYVDLLIINSDISFDAHAMPQMLDGRASIAQDLKHMMLESGLLVGLIGERDQEARQSKLVQLVQLVEDDRRIIPGTAKFTEKDVEQYWFTAQTFDFNSIGFWL